MPADRPSLWQDVAQGKARAPVLVLLTFILLTGLTGFVLAGSYLVSMMVPWLNRYRGNPGYVYVAEETLGWMSVLGALLFIVSAAWVWTRGRPQYHRIFHGVAAGFIVIILTIALCIFSATMFRGDEEFMVLGVIALGVAGLLGVWLWVYRWSTQRRAWLDGEGKLDLRCPRCGYSMIGLKEARCPECGTVFTIDELVKEQDFGPVPETMRRS